MHIDKKFVYRPDIDGLRALAILLVVAFHYYPHWIEGSKFLQGGFIGVDIFFVISGFLITKIICDDIVQNEFSLKSFYSRRIRRIFPSLLLMLTAVLLFGWYVLLPDEYSLLTKYVLSGIGFSSNFISWSEIGYFDDSADVKPLLHLWSLGIEEQFYIFWPVFILLLVFRKIYLYIFIIFLISFYLNIIFSIDDSNVAFYNPITRAWELIIGGIVALISQRHEHSIIKNIYFTNILAIFGLILIIFGVIFINGQLLYPYFYALIPTLGAAFIILAGSNAIINKYFLSNRYFVYIGLISFPLYLWHWPLLVLFKISFNLDAVSLISRIALFFLSLFLAAISYQYIEIPIRKSGEKFIKLLLGFSFILGIISLLSSQGYISPRQSGESINKILLSKTDWVYPGNQFTSQYTNGLRYYKAIRNNNVTLFIGDSNLEQYSSRVNFLLKNSTDGINSVIFIGNQRYCSTLEFLLTDGRITDKCKESYDMFLKILHTNSINKIVIAAQWNNYLNYLQNINEAKTSIEKLFGNNKIYFILTMPTGEELDPNSMFQGNRFLSLSLKGTNEFDLELFKKNTITAHSYIQRIAKGLNHEIIDPIKYLCYKDKCPIYNDHGYPLYKDSKHMTSSYARNAAVFIDQTVISP